MGWFCMKQHVLCTGMKRDNDNDNILFDHNIQIYTTDLQ